MLTDRRAGILGMVVNAYIDTAEPVSSRALAEREDLDVSPATIRNELARLEDEGYITHPYTSAGRVPSDRGYRIYVETLMAEEPIGSHERRTIEHQFHQASGGLDEWLQLAASVLAGSVENAVVVSRPYSRVPRLKHVQLVHLREDSALLVAVMDDGRVQQRILSLEEPAGQDELSVRASRLNARLAGRGAPVARDAAARMQDADDAAAAGAIADLMGEQLATAGTYVDGLHTMLEQPEFASTDRMLDAVRHLEAYELYRVLPMIADLAPGSTLVVIGTENDDDWMQQWSVVAAPYGAGADQGTAGAVAVLGPTRMQYARTIPRVRYVAALMGALMHEVSA